MPPSKNKTSRSHISYFFLAAVLLFFLGYYSGFKEGDTSCELKAVLLDNLNLNRVYNFDREVDDEKPDFRDTDMWADWLRRNNPVFAD